MIELMNIKFATTNQRKLAEARAACKKYGIEITQLSLEIDEIQHSDPIAIARDKAAKSYEEAGDPVVVTDTAWGIPAINGFPGGYMKDVAGWLEPENFIALVARYDDRRISFTETIVYYDGKEMRVFSEEYMGEIAEVPRGEGNSVEQIAMFNGRTLAEAHALGENSHESEDYVWTDFAKWYSTKD